jgi:uncharacterized protein DUF4233
MTEPPRSGLRKPAAAVRGVGAAALATEGLVLLLAIVPLRVVGAAGNVGTATIAALAVVSFVLAGLLRRRWAWWLGGAIPLALIGTGFAIHGSLAVLGGIFALVWLYVLRVRATVLRAQPR